MKVLVSNQQKNLSLNKVSVRSVVKEVLKTEEFSTDEVAVYFVTTQEICRLHQQFFNDPSPTDCISFPLDDAEDQDSGYHLLGEVFVCPQTAIEYTQAHSGDIYSETTLYLVHGLLHLIGYDDIEEKERKKMRAAEAKHMENLFNKKLLLKAT